MSISTQQLLQAAPCPQIKPPSGHPFSATSRCLCPAKVTQYIARTGQHLFLPEDVMGHDHQVPSQDWECHGWKVTASPAASCFHPLGTLSMILSDISIPQEYFCVPFQSKINISSCRKQANMYNRNPVKFNISVTYIQEIVLFQSPLNFTPSLLNLLSTPNWLWSVPAFKIIKNKKNVITTDVTGITPQKHQ